jgi:hypothetical protein
LSKKSSRRIQKNFKTNRENKFFIDAEFEQAKKNIENEIKKEKIILKREKENC